VKGATDRKLRFLAYDQGYDLEWLQRFAALVNGRNMIINQDVVFIVGTDIVYVIPAADIFALDNQGLIVHRDIKILRPKGGKRRPAQ
jgi:hypothetical protein